MVEISCADIVKEGRMYQGLLHTLCEVYNMDRVKQDCPRNCSVIIKDLSHGDHYISEQALITRWLNQILQKSKHAIFSPYSIVTLYGQEVKNVILLKFD